MGIGKNLKRILTEQNMTIKDLSAASGISLNTLYSITKRDSVHVDQETLDKIASVLCISPFDLQVDVAQLRETVRSIELVQAAYGSDAVLLLDSFTALNDTGKKKALDYLDDLKALYPKE